MAERRNVRGGAVAKTFRERGTFARASPMAMTNKKENEVSSPNSNTNGNGVADESNKNPLADEQEEKPKTIMGKIMGYLFAGIPFHYPLRKKVKIAKQNFSIGIYWDLVQLFLAFLACSIYIISTYLLSFESTVVLYWVDVVITQFFVLDFFLNWYIHGTIINFFAEWITVVDILTILPVFVSMAIPSAAAKMSVLRCLRIFRLVRVFQGIKWVREMHGIQRQICTVVITVLSIVFIAASCVQFTENDISQYYLECKYINANTNWEPSCSPYIPADAYNFKVENCDCSGHYCVARYVYGDTDGHPSAIRCATLTFFDTFYFIIVTMASVGYGDVHATTMFSQAVVVVFIFSSIILIPMQIAELQALMALKSPYRAPYVPKTAHEPHVILCGHVQNKRKLERFFSEFFHPDRAVKAEQELHAVILGPTEPCEDVRNLLYSNGYDSRVTYVIGSALVVNDLKNVLADQALAMFFLCNTDLNEIDGHNEDASLVLRALSVSNFNPNLRCLVQVIRPEDSTILKDSDIGVISCLDEFKTACIARNALCPGFSTIIENLFHTMGCLADEVECTLTPWYKEYMYGAGMEIYFVEFPKIFLMAMNYNYRRIAEAIFVQYDIVLLGLTSSAQTSLIFNPLEEELVEYANFKALLTDFNVAVLIADDQQQADDLAKGLSELSTLRSILKKLKKMNKDFPCTLPSDKDDSGSDDDEFSAPLPPKLRTLATTQSALSMRNLTSGGLRGFQSVLNMPTAPTEEEDSEGFRSDCSSVDTNDLSDDGFYYSSNGVGRDEISDDEDTYFGYRTVAKKIHALKGTKQDGKLVKNKANNVNGALPLTLNLTSVSGARRHFGSVGNDTFEESPMTTGNKSYKAPFNSLQDTAAKNDISKAPVIPKDRKGNSFGRKCKEIDDANRLIDHVIVTGCDANLLMFLSELRRPAIKGDVYHSVLIIASQKPAKWDSIAAKYNDVYLLSGNITKMETFQRINIDEAYSMVLLASRDDVTIVDNESVDSKTLFAYLKLEQFIPKSVFFSVELTTTSNMTVLNATIMRRERDVAEAEAKKEIALNRLRKQITNIVETGGDSDEEEEEGTVSAPASQVIAAGKEMPKPGKNESPAGSADRTGGVDHSTSTIVQSSPPAVAAPVPGAGPTLGLGLAPLPSAHRRPAGGTSRRMSAFQSSGKFTNSHVKASMSNSHGPNDTSSAKMSVSNTTLATLTEVKTTISEIMNDQSIDATSATDIVNIMKTSSSSMSFASATNALMGSNSGSSKFALAALKLKALNADLGGSEEKKPNKAHPPTKSPNNEMVPMAKGKGLKSQFALVALKALQEGKASPQVTSLKKPSLANVASLMVKSQGKGKFAFLANKAVLQARTEASSPKNENEQITKPKSKFVQSMLKAAEEKKKQLALEEAKAIADANPAPKTTPKKFNFKAKFAKSIISAANEKKAFGTGGGAGLTGDGVDEFKALRDKANATKSPVKAVASPLPNDSPPKKLNFKAKFAKSIISAAKEKKTFGSGGGAGFASNGEDEFKALRDKINAAKSPVIDVEPPVVSKPSPKKINFKAKFAKSIISAAKEKQSTLESSTSNELAKEKEKPNELGNEVPTMKVEVPVVNVPTVDAATPVVEVGEIVPVPAPTTSTSSIGVVALTATARAKFSNSILGFGRDRKRTGSNADDNQPGITSPSMSLSISPTSPILSENRERSSSVEWLFGKSVTDDGGSKKEKDKDSSSVDESSKSGKGLLETSVSFRGIGLAPGDSMRKMLQHGSDSVRRLIGADEASETSDNKLPSMRSDSVIVQEVFEVNNVAADTYEQLYEVTETHHVLPVFGAGRAFVPSCFESLLVQSFYIVLTPIICEKLVSGQLSQTVMQINIPPALLNKKYIDVYRFFTANRVLCLGLYRAARKNFGALLPYVYLAPHGDTVLYPNDRLFCYGSHRNILKLLDVLTRLKSKNPKAFSKNTSAKMRDNK